MPSEQHFTHRCDACEEVLAHTDDSDKLDDDDTDTVIPAYCAVIVVSIKQPNPEFIEQEAELARDLSNMWTPAVQQQQASMGRALTKEEIDSLRDTLDRQLRAQVEAVPELVVVESDRIVLCQAHVPLLRKLGISLDDLIAVDGTLPAAWAPMAVQAQVQAAAPAWPTPAAQVNPPTPTPLPAPVVTLAPEPEPEPSAEAPVPA